MIQMAGWQAEDTTFASNVTDLQEEARIGHDGTGKFRECRRRVPHPRGQQPGIPRHGGCTRKRQSLRPRVRLNPSIAQQWERLLLELHGRSALRCAHVRCPLLPRRLKDHRADNSGAGSLLTSVLLQISRTRRSTSLQLHRDDQPISVAVRDRDRTSRDSSESDASREGPAGSRRPRPLVPGVRRDPLHEDADISRAVRLLIPIAHRRLHARDPCKEQTPAVTAGSPCLPLSRKVTDAAPLHS